MIQKATFFTTTDGKPHATIELAQRHELMSFLDMKDIKPAGNSQSLADALLENKEHIVDLLTMKAGSKPKARKINGATKTRKPKAESDLSVPKPRAATDVPG